MCRAAEAGKIAAQADKLPHTQAIILVGECNDATRSACNQAKLELHTLEDVLTAGKEHPGAQDAREPERDDIATFCYTSGTTGAPKVRLYVHCAHVHVCRDVLWTYVRGPYIHAYMCMCVGMCVLVAIWRVAE